MEDVEIYRTDATGKITMPATEKGGIDWYRYQKEILEPRFNPFIIKLGSDFIAMDENAPRHASRWNRRWWQANNIEYMEWLANSPDLNPTEPVWWQMKLSLRRRRLQNMFG